MSVSEHGVELSASAAFGDLSIPTKRGVEIDDSGERANLTRVLLKGRLAAALHRASVLKALKPPAGANTTTEAGKGGVV